MSEQHEVTQEKRVFVDDMEFIRTWEAADSKADVADALGMKAASVDQRDRNLRNNGVSLKEFPKRNGKKGEEYWARMEQYRLSLVGDAEGSEDSNV